MRRNLDNQMNSLNSAKMNLILLINIYRPIQTLKKRMQMNHNTKMKKNMPIR